MQSRRTPFSIFGAIAVVGGLLAVAVACSKTPASTSSIVGGAESEAQSSQKIKLPMGMNLASPNDYALGYPFKNLMWGARSWLTKNLDNEGPFDTQQGSKFPLDKDGYPLEVPFRVTGMPQPQTIFTIIPNTTEPGRYVLLYDGVGEIGTAMSSKIVESRQGRVVLELKNGEYQGFSIKKSQRGNHIRNVRVLSLADEKADLKANPFREDFLTYCKQWHVLRFMDWMVTNGSPVKEWATRKPATFYTMVGSGGDAIGRWGKPMSSFDCLFGGGVAPEIMIQLANMTQTDPWFCMPHRATPEYMTEFAKLVKANLDPSRKVYIEYSNEVWNWGFLQAGWMINSKVAAEPLAGGQLNGWKDRVVPTEFPYENGTVAKDGGSDHPERIAVLARRCFKTFEQVYAGADRAKLVRVIGVQHAWLDASQRTVKWVMEHGGADAVSPGGYVGPNDDVYKRWEAAGAKLTANQVIADLNGSFKDSAKWTRDTAAIAKQYKLRYVVYEGGQHVQPKDQQETPYMPALKAAQFSTGMYDLYMKNFALHQEVGCDLFCAFSSIGAQGERWGSWGHQERYGQPRSEIPKYGALLDVNTPKSR